MQQADGNLVLYHDGSALWSSGAKGAGSSVVMQSDGNLVIYNGGAAKWSSNTAGFGGAELDLQDDGNAVVYEAGHAIWDWGSGYLGGTLIGGGALRPGAFLLSPNHHYQLVMQQADGNLVLYHDGSALWSSGAKGAGSSVVMQSDGNLVIYNGGAAKWSSGTAGNPGATLALQDDSNAVIYQGTTALWDWTSGLLSSAGGPGINDYPSGWQGAVCTSTGSVGGYCSTSTWTISGNAWDPYGFAYRNCTSWVAWRLNHVNGIAFRDSMGGRVWGNANTWDNTAEALGYAVNNSPAVGAVAQTDAGGFGHVAWVEAVNPGGSITIEEYNYALTGAYDKRTVPASSFVYIHVHDLP